MSCPIAGREKKRINECKEQGIKVIVGLIRLFIFTVLVSFLAACGGGGDGGGDAPASQYSVQANPAGLQFSAKARGAVPVAQDVTATFRGDGLVVGYAPGVPQPTWLNVSIVGSPTASPVTVRFSILTTFQAATTVSTTVRFASGKADGTNVVTQDVPVTYTVTDPLDVDKSSLDFDATTGLTTVPQTIQVTGANINWSAMVDQPWIVLSRSTGAGAGSLDVSANAASLSAGTHTGILTVRDSNTNTVRTLPITFYVSNNRWNASRIGVSLLEFSDSLARPAGIVVTNDQGVIASWSASADVNWLTITPSGTSGGVVTIAPNSAFTAALAANTVHVGTVTIGGSGIATERVRVGYYRSSAAEPTQFHVNVDHSQLNQRAGIVADPIRPYVYIGLATPSVQRLNLVTGVVDNLSPGTNVRTAMLTVSGDGHYLYVGVGALPGEVERIDLDTGVTLPSLQTSACCAQAPIWIRLRGVPLLITNRFDIYNADTGQPSPSSGISTSLSFLSGTRDGSEIWNYGFSVSAFGCTSARSFKVTTRPSTGAGFLTPFQTSPPSIYGTSGCPAVTQFQSSVDSGQWYFVGGYTTASFLETALFKGAKGGFVSVLPTHRYSEWLAVGNTGIKAISYKSSTDIYGSGVEILDQNDAVISGFSGLSSIEGIELSSDDRFLVLLGGSLTASGFLHLMKIP